MIVAVVGCAGGVGRSTLTLELAAALDAIAVDADLGMADLPCGHGPDLHDVLAGRAAPIEAVRGGPVPVLACGRSLAGRRAADETRLAAAVTRAARGRDAILDSPARHPETALAAADIAVIVTAADGAGTHRAQRLARRHEAGLAVVVRNRCEPTVKVLDRRLPGQLVTSVTQRILSGLPDALAATLVERFTTRRHGGREQSHTQPDCPPDDSRNERPTGTVTPPTVAVPSDPRLARSLPTGTPVLQTAPDSRAAAALERLGAAVERCRPPAHSTRSA